MRAPVEAAETGDDNSGGGRRPDKPTLAEMREVCLDERCRTVSMQRALVGCGLRLAPDEMQMRRVAVLDAVIDLLDLFAQHRDVIQQAIRAAKARSNGSRGA
ncbi:hypothetical protein Ga0061061_11620 [Chelatococcus sambhunathii]|uniref:Uncharacterized protein n=1 Tax=Chelatococcus sambhunathii TaxID=363953 RepID=A0ABM9U9N9_9HYPH|nr:hypothetical protein Ga0061061_11620 [Chelatococcus sambhunathii]